MKKLALAFSISIFAIQAVTAQKSGSDPVLLTVGTEQVTRSEFEAIFKKNNRDGEVTQQALDEYIELFINFKLKVREAISMGYDTTTKFKDELAGYRAQLAKPYLTDSEVSEKLLKEAYERFQTDVRCSHILILVDENALPADTMLAYKKAKAIRDRIVKGEDFGKVASEASMDPSAAKNQGDLGYSGPFRLIYPFENAMYKLKVGEISEPVRTRFGYHIIKVTDRRSPAFGEIQAAHIMVKSAESMSDADKTAAQAKIDEIYQKLVNGEDFSQLAKNYSDDKGTAKKGGVLPSFGTSKMVLEFEQGAYQLKNVGDFSKPVKTAYGWHIIKLLDRKPVKTFDEMKAELKDLVSKDSRSQISVKSLVTKLKKEYKFKLDKVAFAAYTTVIDSTYFEGNWSGEKAKSLQATLFTMGDSIYNQVSFTDFLLKFQETKPKKMDVKMLVSKAFDAYAEQKVIEYEDAHLYKKHKNFRLLMNEYHDGILLFELMDEKVWSKAVRDTAGLRAFYESNKSKYQWGDRLEAELYSCATPEIAAQVRQLIEAGKSRDQIVDSLNGSSKLNVMAEKGRYQKGDNEIADKVEWKKGLAVDVAAENRVYVVNVTDVIAPREKTLNESRGMVTADYQNHLEKQWITELKAKYPVSVNKDVLHSIK